MMTYEDICQISRKMNELDKEISGPVSAEINHYTTTKVARIIFYGKQVRLTRYDCTRGDSSEGEHIKCLFVRACNELLEKGKITKKDYEEISKAGFNYKHFFFIDSKPAISEYVPYIMCFSNRDSNEKLWNSEDDKDKCAITFYSNNGEFISKDLWIGHVTKDKSTEIVNVNYSSEQLILVLKDLIVWAISAYGSDFNFIKSLLSMFLSRYRFYVKSEEFVDEDEVRLIFYYPKDANVLQHVKKHLCKEELIEEGGKIKHRKINYEGDHEYVLIDSMVNNRGAKVVLSNGCTMSEGQMKDHIVDCCGFESDKVSIFPYNYRQANRK